MNGPPVYCEPSIHRRLGRLKKGETARLFAGLRSAADKSLFYYKGRKIHPVGLVPMVMTRQLTGAMESLTRIFFRFMMLAPELYRSDHQGFAKLIRLEKGTRTWLDATANSVPGYGPLFMRPDFTVGRRLGKPALAVLELNSLILGGTYIQAVAMRLMKEEVLPRFSTTASRLGLAPTPDMLDYLVRWLNACRGPREGAIALLETLPLGGDFSELPRIERHMKAAGCPVVYGDPKRLVQRRDGVYLKGRRVAYVYRDFSFEDQPGPNDRRMQAFRRLWRDGQVGPGLAADFDQKGILECFTSEDFAAFFSRQEAALLRRHVPWTRVLSERRTRDPRGKRVDLPSYSLRRREDLVLKPSWSAGGEGILIGRHTTAGRWRSAVERAVARPGGAAVQDYVDNPPTACAYDRDDSIVMKDCRFTIGAFHDGSHFGFHMRVSPNHIVNVAQGGALVPLYFER